MKLVLAAISLSRVHSEQVTFSTLPRVVTGAAGQELGRAKGHFAGKGSLQGQW